MEPGESAEADTKFLDNLPPDIATVLKKSELEKSDTRVLRQFMNSRARNGLDIDAVYSYIQKRFGHATAVKVWGLSDKMKEELRTEYEREREEGLAAKKIRRMRTPVEMRGYLATVHPSTIEGCKRLPDGTYTITKKTKAWVRQMCYILARQGDDPMILTNNLMKYFGKEAIKSILKDSVLRGIGRAMEVAAKEALTASGVETSWSSTAIMDEETALLKHCSHNLSHSDIPGIRVVDEQRTLTNVSIVWLRDKLRRLFQKQMPVDSFLRRTSDMFASGMQAVFDADFRREVSETLLPKYTLEKPKLIDEWLNVASYDEKMFSESSCTFFTNARMANYFNTNTSNAFQNDADDELVDDFPPPQPDLERDRGYVFSNYPPPPPPPDVGYGIRRPRALFNPFPPVGPPQPLFASSPFPSEQFGRGTEEPFEEDGDYWDDMPTVSRPYF